jgi:zinc/manganese transport system ATP-binding protein
MRIDVLDLTVSYGSYNALDGVSFSFNPQHMMAIVGPNGGGKSTLFKALMGVIRPSSGSIKYEGLSPDHMAYLPQSQDMDRSFPMNVLEAVSSGLHRKRGWHKGYRPSDFEEIYDLLDRLGLFSLKDRPLEHLSGGQFQRVLFARLLLQSARCILLDEPFVGIDVKTIDILIESLLKLHQKGTMVLTISHDFDIVRSFYGEVFMIARKSICKGPTSEILTLDRLDHMNSIARSWD